MEAIMKLYNDVHEANNPSYNINPRMIKISKTIRTQSTKNLSKWVGVYAAATRDKKSGEDEDDLENKAHERYREMYNTKFNVIHCWMMLKLFDYWSVPRKIITI